MNASASSRFETVLTHALGHLKIEPSVGQRAKLWRHYELVININQSFNITRVIDPEAFAVSMHSDSCAIVAWARDGTHDIKRVLDIGTGAGIPAIPLAVLRPDWHVTAIDGTGKKARFVQEVGKELGLCNLSVRHDRAESLCRKERYDVVVLKAIGPLARCLRFAAPHVRPGGSAVIYKTASVSESERTEGLGATGELGFDQPYIYEYQLHRRDEILRRALWVHRLPVTGN